MLGILTVDKPVGLTSHDVVGQVRKLLRVRKAGHTGTLDPRAGGLLVLCVGGATRFAGYLSARDKTYRARIVLGVSTATEDTEGEVVFRYDGDLSALVDLDRLTGALEALSGTVDQVPPAFSSKKIEGVPAHRLARKGQRPRLKPVTVRIGRIKILSFRLPELEIEMQCSAGTYVRAFARDLGTLLGCGAHLGNLVRTALGDFTLEEAHSLETIARTDPGSIERNFLLPVERGLAWMPEVVLTDSGMQGIFYGQALEESDRCFSFECRQDRPCPTVEVRMSSPEGRFLGVGLLDFPAPGAALLRPKRLMTEAFSFS